MLDYKNNTIAGLNYLQTLEDEKKDLIQSIDILKDTIQKLGGEKNQESLFDFYDGFVELAAYEVDDILCVGEKPYSMFMQDEIISELKNSGVTTIINLMQEHEFNMYDLNPLKKQFKIINIPIIDNTVPTKEVLYKLINTIDSSTKTYIHCNLGLGRTGVVVGFYLYNKYRYKGSGLLQKIQELKIDSTLELKKSPITSQQIEFLNELND